MATGDPLNLPTLRKEQRRVAALLQVDTDTQPVRHKKRRKPLAGEMFWCSYLDPEGKHRDPALDYIRQAFHKNPKMSLEDLKRGFRYVKEKNDELFNKREDEVEGAGKKRNRRRRLGSKSVDFDERAKHRDKENEYKSLKNNLSKSLDGLRLPHIKETNRMSRRKEEKDDGKERMHVRLPKEDEDATVAERRHAEFLRRKKREAYKSRGRKGRRGGKLNYDGDSAYSDMSEDEYPSDPRTLLSDSGMAGTPSEMSEADPFLRYSHGMNPNPDGDEYIRKQMDSRDAMKITGYMGEASFCSCGSDHREVAPCPECHRTESHSKKCSQRRRGRRQGRAARGARDIRGISEDRDNPQTLVGEREASQRCLKCGKAIRKSRETSYVSGIGRPWSRDSSASSGSYRLIRSSSESRLGTPGPEKARSSRSRSVSPPRDRRGTLGNKTTGDMLLDTLERKLREGVFDYDVNVRSVDDIDQTLRIPRDGEDGLQTDDNALRMRKPRAKIDMYRDAYIKALSVARGKNLPSEPWMLGNRTSKAFVYSYYHYIPRRKPQPLAPAGDEGGKDGDQQRFEPPHYIKKRGAEMKMIFGNVNPDDYLPGGPKNPFEPNPLAYLRHERNSRAGKGPIGRRRVQEAKPSNMKGRKASTDEIGKI